MKVMTFGEIMLRLKTPEYLKILQADGFEASYGGAESNVAVSLAMFGDEAAYVTKIPDNPVGLAALGAVRRFGVDTSCVLHGGSRLGIYYFEKGTNIRPTNVVYDREYSALALADAAEFDWEKILKDIDIFYFSGVTPAISGQMEQAVLEALEYCQAHSIQVVCDLNYRSKMWNTEKAQQVMKQLMNYVDLCIANDEDFEATLGIHAFNGDMAHGIDQIDSYKRGMEEILRQYPNCRAVASVLRNIRTVEDGDLSEGWSLLRESGTYGAQSGGSGRRGCLCGRTAAWNCTGIRPSENHRFCHHCKCSEADDPEGFQCDQREGCSSGYEGKGYKSAAVILREMQ